MTDDRWNQDDSWAEDAGWHRTDADGHDWAEDVRSGAAWQMHGHAVSESQSGLGIASLVLSIIAGVTIAVPMAFALVLVAQNPVVADDDPRAAIAGCGMIVGMLLAGLAVVLGLIGLFQQERSKTCAVLGLLFGGIELCGMGGLLVLGLLFG